MDCITIADGLESRAITIPEDAQCLGCGTGIQAEDRTDPRSWIDLLDCDEDAYQIGSHEATFARHRYVRRACCGPSVSKAIDLGLRPSYDPQPMRDAIAAFATH